MIVKLKIFALPNLVVTKQLNQKIVKQIQMMTIIAWDVLAMKYNNYK